MMGLLVERVELVEGVELVGLVLVVEPVSSHLKLPA
jgi:hypothetical protein|tara:strand:- start:310 stop:417 length:108 start_codon:yes stop_codon:yes gene_type:complete